MSASGDEHPERSPFAADAPRRFDGAVIPTSPYAGDDGSAEPVVVEALGRMANGTASLVDVQRALVGRRVMLPTTALLDESTIDVQSGLEHEKSSHMAAAIFRADAGWSGLLVFTGVESVARWSADARPIPVTADEAATAALEDGCDALILDFSGPVRIALSGSLLRALAQSREWQPPFEDVVVLELIADAAREVGGVRGVDVRAPQVSTDASARADALVVISIEPDADAADVATRLAQRLALEPAMRDRLDHGLAFAIDAPA